MVSQKTAAFPADTLRNNDVVITSKRRHFDVITSKWRRFDVITMYYYVMCSVVWAMVWWLQLESISKMDLEVKEHFVQYRALADHLLSLLNSSEPQLDF